MYAPPHYELRAVPRPIDPVLFDWYSGTIIAEKVCQIVSFLVRFSIGADKITDLRQFEQHPRMVRPVALQTLYTADVEVPTLIGCITGDRDLFRDI